MNCNLTNTERINGSFCRSWTCEPCREFKNKEDLATLKAQLTEANEALGFYGNEENWKRSNKHLFTRIIANDVEPTKNKEVQQVWYKYLEVGDKKARAYCKKYGVE